MYRRRQKAFTMIELLISIAGLSIVLLGLISGYLGCLRINEMSKNTMIATEDARRVIEQMRKLAVDDLASITSENWTTWAANNGCTALDAEQISVAYTDRDASGNALDDDPLEITVTVTWQDGGRSRVLNAGILITVR
ncbi:MAG: type II secretion system GspH family protein [Candidatus Omnitrophica bacterium]|nr:type II secretion system GspH family protein [Candidatus Omnitrophota bacterium]MBU1925446.1 type II secretion system GspH family protein [Candidatus Omnitrophota bacterium]